MGILTQAQRDTIVREAGPHEIVTSPEVEPLWFAIRKDAPDWFSIGLTQEGRSVRDSIIKEDTRHD